MLIDSTVFIDYLRGKKEAKDFLDNSEGSIKVSVIVVMEIITGLVNKRQIDQFFSFLEDHGIEIIHISVIISQKALDLFRDQNNKKAGIADCLIAATALENKEKLVTHNTKHFSLMKNLKLHTPY